MDKSEFLYFFFSLYVKVMQCQHTYMHTVLAQFCDENFHFGGGVLISIK